MQGFGITILLFGVWNSEIVVFQGLSSEDSELWELRILIVEFWEIWMSSSGIRILKLKISDSGSNSLEFGKFWKYVIQSSESRVWIYKEFEIWDRNSGLWTCDLGHIGVLCEFYILTFKFWFLSFKFQAPNSEFRIQSSKFRVPSLKYWIQGSKFQVLNSKFQVPYSEFWVLNSKFLILILDFWDFIIPSLEFWDFGIQSSKFRPQNLEPGVQKLKLEIGASMYGI